MSQKHNHQLRTQSFDLYSSFDELDGSHPWMQACPEGFVAYRVRELNQGRVAYFNYILAKEMGLIDADHPQQMTPELEAKLIKTFSIQIINEYDELSQRRIDPKTIKANKYMATRYLQLQHSNKQGKTSGDGRGIWNGTVEHKGKTWDVSSRGTGVTCLAPGAVQANRPLKTGGTEFGYGCGLAEIDELLAAAILAETMYLQGINTERVLAIVDLGKGYGIGVRAAQNLLRPAHIFLYLKQERWAELKAGTEYLIDRQVANQAWKVTTKGNARYDEVLNQISDAYAKFTAQLDIDYVFAWLDWDGDNVLADAGIIDYGSVRQFGARHDKYRYDDVERFSTNLNEQRQKARLIVQVFAQLFDYLKTKNKKPLRHFNNHPVVSKFNQAFSKFRSDRLLYRMGFNAIQRENILRDRDLYEKFDRHFSLLERAKISGNLEKVADGVNQPPLYNMREALRLLSDHYYKNRNRFEEAHIDNQTLFKAMLSSFCTNKRVRMGKKHERQLSEFQRLYKQLVATATGSKGKVERTLSGLFERSQKLNSPDRITGNALIEIVDEIITQKKRGLPLAQIQRLIDRLVFQSAGLPEVPSSRFYRQDLHTPVVKADLIQKVLNLVQEHRDDI